MIQRHVCHSHNEVDKLVNVHKKLSDKYKHLSTSIARLKFFKEKQVAPHLKRARLHWDRIIRENA